MALSKDELKLEENYLENTSKEISNQIDVLGKEIHVKKEKLTEFRKVLWEDKGSIDASEMQTGLMSSEFEASFMLMKMDYYRKLLKLPESPLDPNFIFAYDLPNDCACPREIIRLKTEKVVNFKIATVNKKLQLWCNRDEAVLRYTGNNITEDEITSNFAIALSWYLAFLSAPSITGARATQSDCLQVYSQLIDAAQVVNANFDNDDEEQYNNWLEAR